MTGVVRPSLFSAASCALVLAGCVTVDPDQSVQQVNQQAATFTGGALTLARTPEESSRRAALAAKILAAPLEQRDAVQLALANSPALPGIWPSPSAVCWRSP